MGGSAALALAERQGAVRVGFTALALAEREGALISVSSLLFSFFSAFVKPPSSKTRIPALLHSPASHHLQVCPWSAWCCADRSGCTLMVPYDVTRRVSSAYHSAVAGASQSSRGVQSTLRVLPPHSGP